MLSVVEGTVWDDQRALNRRGEGKVKAKSGPPLSFVLAAWRLKWRRSLVGLMKAELGQRLIGCRGAAFTTPASPWGP
jgi:hypothetical protein